VQSSSLPNTHLVNPISKTFSTERLQLAIYLHASQRLPFLRCEAQKNGKIRFHFDDSNHCGSEAELEFDRGAKVAATDLFASQKFLRRKMSEELNTGESKNHYGNRH